MTLLHDPVFMTSIYSRRSGYKYKFAGNRTSGLAPRAPPGKGRQIRRLPQTSGWVFIVEQTEKYCFIAFYTDKRYFETKKVAIILLKSKFSLE